MAGSNSRLGCFLWLVAAGIFVLIVVKAAPVKIKSAQFEDFLADQARFAARSTTEQLKKRIMERAAELDIPLDPKNLEVRKSPRRVRIVCSYTIPLEFPFFTYEWEFEHTVDRPIFVI